MKNRTILFVSILALLFFSATGLAGCRSKKTEAESQPALPVFYVYMEKVQEKQRFKPLLYCAGKLQKKDLPKSAARIPYDHPNPYPEAIQQVEQDTSMPDIFKDFLINNASAAIAPDADFTWLPYRTPLASLESGTAVTLTDMCQCFASATEERTYYFRGVKYGLLDCGKDGKPELAIRFITYDGSVNETTAILSIRDNKPVITCIIAAYGRSQDILYTDGCYFGDHEYNRLVGHYYMIDKNGCLHHIYDWEGFAFMYNLYSDNYDINEERYRIFPIVIHNDKEFTEEEIQEREETIEHILERDKHVRLYTTREVDDAIRSYIVSLGLPDYDSYHHTNGSIIDSHKAILNNFDGIYIPDHNEKDEVQWLDLIIIK